MSGNIKVVVRCRPLNSRELARGAKGLVRMEGNNTYLEPPEAAPGQARNAERETKSFAFDKSYWSACPKDEPGYASQETLYNDLGKDLLDHSFEGFNTCIFAYGQTGSGKSYSMMGYGADRGIIPLICEALFERITTLTTSTLSFTVEVSYTEIYQEKVRDLLNPANKGNLKVREHPSTGPYVESLSKLAVQSFADVEALMDEGTKARTVAATNMNETSSRSHAVFTLLLTQRRQDLETSMAGEKVSRISLVDLAGSERANSTGATGTRLKEGALINKSLTTLGRVIAALAAASSATGGKAAKAAAEKVPYRDSVLTWLLKDSLGGNSKTAMVAAISPADYEETLSTLRYADQAKKIKNKAVVNEDPNAKLIRELKEELAVLRTRMTSANLSSPSFNTSEGTFDPDIPPEQQIVQYRNKEGEIKTISKAELQDQLEASERLMASVTETWEEKLVRAQEVQIERESALEALGITIEKNLVGVHAPKKTPHLVNLNEDALMAECLVYQIKPGRTVVGNVTSDKPAEIRLSGSSILAEHCHFESEENGKVTLHSRPDSTTMVNGLRIAPEKPRELKSGFRIILGDFHVFRFNHPEEVRKARETGDRVAELRSPHLNGFEDGRETGSSSPATRPESPMSTVENADWSYAFREAVVARLPGTNVDLDKLRDEDLNKLYSDILKVRHSRTGSSVGGDVRSESRMSFMDSVTEDGTEEDDDDDSRGSPSHGRYSGSTWSTNPTSVGDSTITINSPPEVEERLQAVKEEYEERIKSMVESAAQVSDVRAEKQQMEVKLRTLETQMRVQKQRFEKQLRSGDASFDSFPLSERDEQRARAVVQQWRRRRRVRMAEEALSHAVTIKEANVISAELKKGVSFQFVVVERNVPPSASEAIEGLADIDEVSDAALAQAVKPCLGVKVLDRRNNAVYVWSLSKLQARLQQMRNLYKFIGTEYSQHFSWEDPFYESPPLPGGFSFVGSALVSLAPLSRNIPSSSHLQLYSPYTADPVGSCRVRIKPISATTPPSIAVNGNDELSTTPFDSGSTLELELIVDRISGMTKSEYASAHIQVHQSSLFGPSYIAADDALCSIPVDYSTSSTSDLKLKKRLSVTLTPDILSHLSSGYASVELFARVRPAHLDKIERWDEARDSVATSKVAHAPSLRGDPETDVTRTRETELVNEQQHDVLAGVEIRELGETGEYVPVQVVAVNALDSGAFFLRQGLQRKFVLKLSHNSGRGWLWKTVSKVTLGNVRLLDARGRIHAATPAADVVLWTSGKARASFSADGTATLSFTAAWDSSVHDSPFLNKNTVAGSRALLRLRFEIASDVCALPVVFTQDIAVTVQGRDARPPSKLLSMFSSSRLASRITNLFDVRLRPAMTKRAADIWRLNTADTFVRGEESLGNWKPRGLSLIRDHDLRIVSERKAADVEATKAVLAAFELTLPAPNSNVDSNERLTHAVELWQRHFGPREEVSLDPEQPVSRVLDLSPSSSPAPGAITPPKDRKLVGTTTMIPRSETAVKRGYLAMLRDPTSERWKKYWVVLKRPYLYLYEHSSEAEEAVVINVSTVRVEQSQEIEQMLERKFSFAIFTHQNSYFFQAPSLKDMIQWIKSIDPSLVAT